MVDDDNTISIVIRVRNGARDLRRCLSGLRTQRLLPGNHLQIIVVDNESTDGSAEVGRRYGADIVTISTNEFSWGRALNRGIATARGGKVLLLSADAYPADANWVIEMLEPFRDSTIVAVYGRQMPRPDAPIDEHVRLLRDFGGESICVRSWSPDIHASGAGMRIPVSNACAAIRRRLWEQIPYDEVISGGEEGLWTVAVLQDGHSVCYQATARVYHSHRDTVLRWAWRHWELLRKNIELQHGRGLRPGDVFRALAVHARRRCLNCMSVRLRSAVIINGIGRLPCELAALLVVSAIAENPDVREKWRHTFWG